MTIHMQTRFNPPPKMFLVNQVLCGFKITNKIRITNNKEEVTCKRCLRDLKRMKYKKEKNMNNFYIPHKLAQEYINKYDKRAFKRVISLLELMEEAVNWADIKKVYQVHKFFNQVEYQPDKKVWNKKDYWASRLEFLGKGCGDCEDFALAKYLTLKQLGVPKIYLTYALIIGSEERHLLVSYFSREHNVYLDNNNIDILPINNKTNIAPVYAFTENKLYLQNSDGLGKQIKRDLLQTQIKLNQIPVEIEERK